MTIAALKTAANPAAALVTFAVFALIVGVYYLVKNWRKVRRWWRRITGGRHFWGYVTAAVLFVGFALFFIFLDVRY